MAKKSGISVDAARGIVQSLNGNSGSSRKRNYDHPLIDTPQFARSASILEEMRKREAMGYSPTPEEDDVGPVRNNIFDRLTVKDSNDRSWLNYGLLGDGVQEGDIAKTILGTGADLLEDLVAGMAEIPEKIADASAAVIPYFAQSQLQQAAIATVGQNNLIEQFDLEQSKKDAAEFAKKDLYDGTAVAREILSNAMSTAYMNSKGFVSAEDGAKAVELQKESKKYLDERMEAESLLGEKLDSLAQSGGQMLGTAALQAYGVPWFATIGGASFGAEFENALNQEAEYEEALGSAAISAGAEVLSEKLFGGIKFGGKATGALDDVVKTRLSRGISNKLVRNLMKIGVDFTGEGVEEVVSEIAGNLGSSLYREENVWELLTNEEALNGYIEAFVGGGIMGGVSGAFQAATSGNRDYTSQMTKAEEAVVKQIYEERLKNEGKKPSQKRKDEIYNKVISEMERGDISVSDIEQALGGDSFTEYKTAMDIQEDNDFLKEYDDLRKKTEEKPRSKKQRATQQKNQAKLAQMEERVQAIRDNREALRKKLRGEVLSQTQDSKLMESFRQQSLRGEGYKTDLSQYSEKQQQIYKKAMESGVVNNTRKAHELVDLVAKIAEDKDLDFDFTNNARLKESGFAIEGKTVNGFVTKDGVTLNMESAKVLDSVVGHEVTHVLEGTEVYDALKDTIFEYAKARGDFDGRLETLTKLYEGQEADVEKELVADLVGEYLFDDSDFIMNLSVRNRDAFEKIGDEISYFLRKVTAGSREQRRLLEVQRKFEEAYRASGKVMPEDRQYSISDSNGRQLTAEQQDFFKDSKVRDENGNLKVMYHGTPNGNLTVFKEGTYFTDSKEYADRYQNPGASSISTGKEAKNPKTFEVYLDIKKPFDINDAEARDIYINEYIKGGNAMGINPYLSDAEYAKINTIDWTEGEDLRDFLIENEYDYDGLVLDEGGTGGYGDEVQSRGKSYVVFSSEQVKNIDNTKPTDSPDIRYSLSEDIAPDVNAPVRYDPNQGDYFEGIAPLPPAAPNTKTVAKEAPIADAPIREDIPKKAKEKPKSEESDTVSQRRKKNAEHTSKWENLIGNTTTWKDMSTGLQYKTKTLRRILRKVVRDARGNPDIKRADAIYDELETKYDHHEALLKRESAKLKEPFRKLNLNHNEDQYAQMLGELRYNPETTLTKDVVKDYLNKHKGRINEAKVNKAIEESRKLYDDLLIRVNEVLREQGFKEIPYRKGYFPHFSNPKQNWFQKMMNWKVIDNEIPTSIAGLTEMFKPNRSWQSFNKQRTGDKTDYSLYQGLDTYIHGALDWIYHIDDLQSRRSLENLIRYTHSDKGIQERIDAIKESNLDAEETQRQIDAVLAEASNPLSGLVRELMNRTNTLANKKSSMDRGVEDMMNRKIYSTMTNLNNRITANQVVGSLSSAMTNFIPIVQSWHQVSPAYTLVGLGDFVRSTIKDDGMVAKSDFLTNRLMEEKKLYQTGWDKVSDKAAFMMNIADRITAQTVWRSKYYQNLREGMSEAQSIRDADQFCKNLMAGRSRGNAPTIFDAKNPFVKVFTAFQLEVANQYGYMFDDVPKDSKNVVRLVEGYAAAFFGAHLYNALYSSLVGRDAAFDPIKIIEELMSGLLDDEEENEDVLMDFGEDILEQMPYVSGLLGGGRIPISSAFPYSGYDTPFQSMLDDIKEGKDDGNWTPLIKEMLKPLYYIAMPVAGGQIKKTNEGIGMFSDDHPIAGSYTASGNLRFPVEDTLGNRVQAALFGQYANENAQKYFDEDRSVLYPDQIEIFKNLDMPIEEYWEYQDTYNSFKEAKDELKDIANSNLATDEDILKSKYASAIYSDLYDLYDEQKKIVNGNSDPLSKKTQIQAIQKQMSQMLSNTQSDLDNVHINGYYATIGDKRFDYSDYNHKWHEISGEYLEKEQRAIDRYGIEPEEYWNNTDLYYKADWYFDSDYADPELETVAKLVFGGERFAPYAAELSQIYSDKDANGNTISGSKKRKVYAYIDGLPVSDGLKAVMKKMSYPSDKSLNRTVREYLEQRPDLTYTERQTILDTLNVR